MLVSSHPLPSHGPRKPFGVMLHTTGDGVPARAYSDEIDPLEAGRLIYGTMKEGPHYCISPDGSIDRYREPDQVAYHCGVSALDRRDFLSGHWEAKVPRDLVSWWKARWPGVLNPSHLYPSTSANLDYIGIELIPCGTYLKGNGGSWKPVFGKPIGGAKGRFTGAQYVASALLSLQLSVDYSIMLRKTGRVVEHSDINPITRPGWDIGGFAGFWDWNTWWGVLDGLERHVGQ